MRYSGIGGQAVMEGVMMRNGDKCAVAVRMTDKKIELKEQTCTNLEDKYPFARVPLIRGIVKFVESLSVGLRSLNYSASLLEEEEEKKLSEEEKKKEETKEGILSGILTVFAIVLAIGIFLFLPMWLTNLLRKVIPPAPLRGLLEGIIRVALFVGYVKLISLMKDIERVFMYHGAEHKCINCIETGNELNVENAKKASKVHKRCGTNFLFVVMLLSILFFMFIDMRNAWLRMLLRILLIPVIASVSYEFIRYAGSHDNKVVQILCKPGLWLQSLTTKEPDDEMLEVAIASVEAVFDWKAFLAETPKEEPEEKAKENAEKKRKKDDKEEIKAKKEKDKKKLEIEVLDLDEDEETKE